MHEIVPVGKITWFWISSKLNHIQGFCQIKEIREVSGNFTLTKNISKIKEKTSESGKNQGFFFLSNTKPRIYIWQLNRKCLHLCDIYSNFFFWFALATCIQWKGSFTPHCFIYNRKYTYFWILLLFKIHNKCY